MSAREEIASLLWRSVPSSTNEEAKERAEQMLDAFAAEVRAAALLWAASRFEAECPANGGSLDLCMCHAADPLRELASAGQATAPQRCPSCDHEAKYHAADDGRCWFTVDHGVPGSNLVCPCVQTESTGAES